MSLEIFGDGGDGEDMVELAARYGYELRADDQWWNPKDDTDGDTIKTDAEMWTYIEDRRESDMEDFLTS